MKSKIFMLIAIALYSGLFSTPVHIHEEPLSLLLQANSAQDKSDKSTISTGSVELLKAWKIKRFLYRNLQHRAGAAPPDEIQIKPADKHFFLALEMAFKKGETLVRTEPVSRRSPPGDPLILDLIYTGSLGHRIPLTSASVIDASGDQYLPVASVCGTGVYLVQPLGGIKSTIFAPGMTDIGFPDDVGFAESGRFVLLYEVPAKRGELKLKVGDAESITVPVKN